MMNCRLEGRFTDVYGPVRGGVESDKMRTIILLVAAWDIHNSRLATPGRGQLHICI